MLTAEELDKLFNLLERLHSDKKLKRDRETMTVWRETLSPWSYGQVRSAAFHRAQSGNRFFPDAPELAAFCPKEQREEGELRRDAPPPNEWRERLERYRELQTRRRSAGLPATLEEARMEGRTAGEWHTMLEQAGLGVEAIL